MEPLKFPHELKYKWLLYELAIQTVTSDIYVH